MLFSFHPFELYSVAQMRKKWEEEDVLPYTEPNHVIYTTV